jgi:hypothetical protein
MYAEGRILGKSGALQQDIIREKQGIRAALVEFGGSPAGAWTPPPAENLYDHIIFLDGAHGECYGRTKSQRLPNQ